MTETAEAQTSSSDDRQTETRRCAVLDNHERYVVRRWWQQLTLGESEAKRRDLPPPWPRGLRAVLRRCESADAAVLTEAFRKLWQMLENDKEGVGDGRRECHIEAWACAALVAAELRDETPGVTPGRALGSQRKETDRPCMSELRFQQLQQSQSPDELVRRMRRAIALVGQKNVSVVNLVDDVLLWCQERRDPSAAARRRVEDRIAFRWANDYFTTLARYQRD